jgi:hypothetical protein
MFPNAAFIFSFSEIAALICAALACLAVYFLRPFFSVIAKTWVRFFLPWLFCFVALLLILDALYGRPLARFEVVYLQ